MRQVKRFIYFVLLNIIISAVTVVVVLQLWERDHPVFIGESTPLVLVVTPTQSIILPLLSNNSGVDEINPVDAGVPITETRQTAPTVEMLSYQVKEGDTLGALAVEFNVSVADIMTVNGMTDPDSLFIGQIIYIPTAPLPTATSTYLTPTIVVSITPRPTATRTPGPTPTRTPTPVRQEPQVVIETVIGVGTLESERVDLLRSGDGELSLAGWRLEDGAGNIYTFPDLTLYSGGEVHLYSRTGQDTVVELFWGLTTPVWRTGKTVSLYDAQNVLRSSYTVP